MDKDINRELAEDAAEDYSSDENARHHFTRGWVEFAKAYRCYGLRTKHTETTTAPHGMRRIIRRK